MSCAWGVQRILRRRMSDLLNDTHHAAKIKRSCRLSGEIAPFSAKTNARINGLPHQLKFDMSDENGAGSTTFLNFLWSVYMSSLYARFLFLAAHEPSFLRRISYLLQKLSLRFLTEILISVSYCIR